MVRRLIVCRGDPFVTGPVVVVVASTCPTLRKSERYFLLLAELGGRGDTNHSMMEH
jgi:hypothetical protein